MSYQALLFYRDEKTARVLMQVLDELDFSVSPESEPFAAVKTLLAQRFDLLLVDCEDEQNASLLFKSARNSDCNHSAVAVAVTTGQAGIAHAFRAGASLVLTKPISVEQAKSTLRLARGALRKAEAQKPAEPQKPSVPLSLPVALAQAAHAGTDFETAPPPVAPPVFKSIVVPVPIEIEPAEELPRPEASTSAPAPAEDLDAPAAVHAVVADEAELEPPQEHLARSGADLTNSQAKAWSPAEEESPLHLSPKPGSAIVPVPASSEDGALQQSDSARREIRRNVAPARSGNEPAGKAQAARAVSAPPAAEATLRFASLGIKDEDEDLDPAKSRKNFFIAAVLVLALGGGGYYAWMRLHPTISLPFLNHPAASAAHPAANPSAPPQSQPAQPTGDVAPGNTAAGATSNSPLATLAASAPTAETTQPDTAKPVAPPSSVASGQTVNPAVLSEDVSQALVTTKVQPIYPEAAKHARLEGSVRLQVNISPRGDVTGAKLLSGNATLAASAIAAVRQWKYQAYYVNGQPVAIETQATLGFKLP